MDRNADNSLDINLGIIRIRFTGDGLLTAGLIVAGLFVVLTIAFCTSYNHMYRPYNYVDPPTPYYVVITPTPK